MTLTYDACRCEAAFQQHSSSIPAACNAMLLEAVEIDMHNMAALALLVSILGWFFASA
jgi:hypothetical protein